ncbi:serine/arginine repetitive matrix protein 1-like [Iris pallida]|uniref:Serine/arginine repetitive matrix protein 1-like n=1 Tax=Iris pallida TaxID=29817 RepID=A0AAX6GML7_IRIPA|nr:serine/arginine repetitive matrix protein 1-like [Iris pallida]
MFVQPHLQPSRTRRVTASCIRVKDVTDRSKFFFDNFIRKGSPIREIFEYDKNELFMEV